MMNNSSFKSYMVFLFVYMQGLSLLYTYFYWQNFGVNALDYISFNDIIFAPLEFLIGYVALIVFVLLQNRAFALFRRRVISHYDNFLFFSLCVFLGVFSFLLSKLDYFIPSYSVFNYIFYACMIFIPEFFPYTPWGQKYFRSPTEAYAYSATFFIGLAMVSWIPSWTFGLKVDELNHVDNQMPVVKLINCQKCEYSVLGKLGSFVIAYDRKAGAVISISDRNVEYIQHHQFYTPEKN
ncbi:hypothetical protein AAG587_11125 [Vreelandella neptunia]|uniref:hypothetical protein n=1 Tax=Vreelandella neptunia TaxID=115551 RepID=UPI00315A8D83